MVLFLFPNVGQAKKQPTISAENAILMEEETGRVLFAKEADEQRPIASITKVMTALVAIRYGDLSDKITISKRAANSTGSSVYLEEDKEMTLEDLLYGLILRSGNDASVAIAEHVGGSMEGFVYLMNETAAYIGMNQTHFTNPHGLDDADHYSTAADMALLMREAHKNDIFKRISGTETYQAKGMDYPWHNKNKLLTSIYPPTTGGKTGYTTKAGRTLLTTAEKDQLALIAVTLHAPDDWNDQMKMYEWGFDTFKMTRLDESGKQIFEKDGQLFTGFTSEEIIYPLQQGEQNQIHKQVEVKAKLNEEDDKIGRVRYVLHADVLKEIPLYKEKNKNKKNYFIDIFFHVLKVQRHG